MNKQHLMSRRQFLKTTLTASAALLPATSVLAGGTSAPASLQSEITIITSGWPLTPMPTAEEIEADQARAGYAEALQMWLDENPGVTFQQIEADIWDQQAVVTLISGGTAPTYVFPTSIGGWSNAGARNAFVQGLMADVGPAVEKYGLIAKLTPGALSGWQPINQVNDGYMSYPIDSGMDIFYYRRDLLAELGVEEPPMDWTWDDLIATAKALTGEGHQGLGAPTWMAGAVLNDHGFGILSRIPSPESGWNWMRDTSDPKWAELLAAYRKLIFEDKAVYSDVSYTTDNFFNAFINGAIGLMRTNVLGAFGSAAQENSMAALANRVGKPYEEVIGFRGIPRGDNGYLSNPIYVGGVAISPDTNEETMLVALSAVDYMFLGTGWDVQKAGQYAATQDLQAVFNYPLPIDGKYTYEGVPGAFEDAWGQRTKDDILYYAGLPKAPDEALYLPVEQNPGPDNQTFDDAWSTINYVAEGVDPAAVLTQAADTWNSQAAGFSSSVDDAAFIAGAKAYYEALDAFWKDASPEFYESTFKPWYDSKVLPALG
jgi:hypothetical protein